MLGWSERVSLSVPSASTRLSALASNRALTKEGVTTEGLLDLLGYPMVIFGRPRDLGQMDSAMAQLLEVLSAPSSGGGVHNKAPGAVQPRS
jgi:hypothetical protein